MTTPSVDLSIVMPYGVTVQGSDSQLIPQIVGNHPKRRDSAALYLTPGPCRISASWSGPEEMRLMLNGKNGAKRILTIPAQSGGGGHAPRWSHGEHSTANPSTCKQRAAGSPGRTPALSRCIPSCPSSSAPRRGGGVDGWADDGASRSPASHGAADNENCLPRGSQRRLYLAGGRSVRRDRHLAWAGGSRGCPQLRRNRHVAAPLDHQRKRVARGAQGYGAPSFGAPRAAFLPPIQRVEPGRKLARLGPSHPRESHVRLRGNYFVATAGVR